MVGMLIPSVEDNLLEPWKGDLEVLKLKVPWLARSPLLRKEERTVVGKRR